MKKSLSTGVGAALLLGVLAALNLLANYAYFRLDLSRGRAYSLSRASRELAAKLDDPVHIRAYFSDNLPPQFKANRRYLESFLKEYASASKGKVDFKFMPLEGAKAEENRRAAMEDGIAPIRFNIYSNEKLEVAEGLMGLTLRYEDQKEALPAVGDVSGIEYDISSRIKKMLRKERAVIGFASGIGGLDSGKLGRRVRETLSQTYELRDVDLSSPKEPIKKDVSALVILGPSQSLGEAQRYAIDQFLLSGRPVAAALDTHRVDLQAFSASPLPPEAYGWLAPYGLSLRPFNVLDQQNQKVTLSSQQGWIQISNIIDYPPMVLATDLDRDSPVTKDLDAVVLPFASPVEVSSGVRAAPLIRSSGQSWIRKSEEKGYVQLDPTIGFKQEPSDPKGPFVLAAVVEGRFPGAFKEPPKGMPKEGFLAKSEKEGRLLVIGTSRLVPRDAQDLPSNQAFFLNVVDWLAQSSDLIAIRSKAPANSPLKAIPDGAKTLVRYADIFGPAFAVLVFGGLRWSGRRRWKASRSRAYLPPQA